MWLATAFRLKALFFVGRGKVIWAILFEKLNARSRAVKLNATLGWNLLLQMNTNYFQGQNFLTYLQIECNIMIAGGSCECPPKRLT